MEHRRSQVILLVRWKTTSSIATVGINVLGLIENSNYFGIKSYKAMPQLACRAPMTTTCRY